MSDVKEPGYQKRCPFINIVDPDQEQFFKQPCLFALVMSGCSPNGIARRLKKLCKSQGGYWIKQ